MQRQSALRAQRLQAGAKLIGWKVGFGAPAAMEKLKLTGPLVGFLLDQGIRASGATVPVGGWHKPVAEPEIAILLGRDVAADADDTAARAAVAALAPALEIADADGPMDDVEVILAKNIFQRHVIVGPHDTSRAGARLEGLSGHLDRSGHAVAVPADLQANTGNLIAIVRQ